MVTTYFGSQVVIIRYTIQNLKERCKGGEHSLLCKKGGGGPFCTKVNANKVFESIKGTASIIPYMAIIWYNTLSVD
jgi:hypothetical protein